jgi:uncharacterized membrane protein YhaH (DUF805 family)
MVRCLSNFCPAKALASDAIPLPEKDRLLWLFFRLSGRVSRAAYVLGFLLMMVVMSFPVYQLMRVDPESTAAMLWVLAFGATVIAFVWSHFALSVKRLHDLDRPGILVLTLLIPVVSIVAFVAFCIMPGSPGPNQYGQRTNAPAGAS